MNSKVLEGSQTKCDGCGSEMIFDPQTQNLVCEHCGLQKDFEKSNVYEKHNIKDKPTSFEGYQKWKDENKVLRCESCGAQVVLNSLEYSGKCAYCGSSYVSETSLLPSFVPDAIVPFNFDEKQASLKFKERVKRKFFVPRAFKKLVDPEKIKGIYIPTFAFDANTITKYYGSLSTSHTVQTKNGFVTQTRSYPISGIKHLAINDVMIETSSHITQNELRQILPFNMQKCYKFNENFIRGYVVEHFERAFDECYNQSKEAMKARIKSEILSAYSYTSIEHFSMDTKFKDEKYNYKLVPIYQFDYEYKKKKYKTLMNGQTGKIGGGLPKSPLKIALVVFLVIAILAGITVLTIYL